MQKKPPKDLQEFCKNWVMMLSLANSRFPIFMDQWNFLFRWKLWNLPRLTRKQAMNPNFTLESSTKSHNLRHSVEILWVFDLLNELGSKYPLRRYVFEMLSTYLLTVRCFAWNSKTEDTLSRSHSMRKLKKIWTYTLKALIPGCFALAIRGVVVFLRFAPILWYLPF